MSELQAQTQGGPFGGQAIVPATVAMPLGLDEVMERQRLLLDKKIYTPLGRLWKVMIEANTIAVVKGNPLVEASRRRQGYTTPSLDFYGKGPLLAQSGEHLLVVEPMAHPPRIPDPTWKPDPAQAVEWHRQSAEAARRGEKFGRPFPEDPKPPTIAQTLEHRSAGWVQAGRRKWLLFYPANEQLKNRQAAMIFLAEGGWGEIKVMPDAAGRHMALLYNPRSGAAHFVFGRVAVDVYKA